MNFYASAEFLQVLADTYFPGRYVRTANVAIADEVLRLMIVDDHRVVTELPFLDYHVPLAVGEIDRTERWDAFAPWVMRGALPAEERHEVAPGHGLSPYIDWTMFDGYPAYEAFIRSRRAGTLRELRRLRHRLEERHGPIEFSADDRRDDVVGFAVTWKSRQLRATGMYDLFAEPANVRFFDHLRDRDLLVAASLRIAGRLLAVWLGYAHQSVRSGWIFTYDRDPELSRYSPGHQLLQSMLRDSFSNRHREFDFSIGAQEYKWLYATHTRVLGPLGHKQRTARDMARNVLRRVRLLDSARALKQAMHRATGH